MTGEPVDVSHMSDAEVLALVIQARADAQEVRDRLKADSAVAVAVADARVTEAVKLARSKRIPLKDIGDALGVTAQRVSQMGAGQ